MRWLLFIAVVLLSVMALSPALESDSLAKKVTYQCGDGFDNDGDGLTDYPEDPQCIAAYDYSELPQCSDGIDNNGDGLIDYPDDREGCSSPDDDFESDLPFRFTCADGYDNDFDGRIDYPDDPGCRFLDDSSETGGKYPPG